VVSVDTDNDSYGVGGEYCTRIGSGIRGGENNIVEGGRGVL